MVFTRSGKLQGYTLVELLVLLAIVSTLMGLGIPRVVSTLSAMKFRRAVVLTTNFLRQSNLDAVTNGDTLSLKLEANQLIRSDGKKFSLSDGLQFYMSPENKDNTIVIFYPSGRSSSQKFFINDIHDRKAALIIDPLSSIPKCSYY